MWKKLLGLLLVAALALAPLSPASAAIAYVDSAKAVGGTTGGTSGTVNASTANLGVAIVDAYGPNDLSPTINDSSGNGNVWVRRVNHLSPGPGFDINQYFYDCLNCTFTNGMTVSVSSGGANIYLSFGVGFYSGVGSYGAAAAGSYTAATTAQPGSQTAPGNGYLYVTGVSINNSNTASINSGFAIRQQNTGVGGNHVGFGYADLIQATAAAVNPTWSNLDSGASNPADMVYYAPTGAPPPTTSGKVITNILN